MTGSPRSTTRRDLVWLAAALVLLTLLTAVFALAAFARAQGTADTVRADSAPAVIAVAAARAALVEADRAAVTSFSTGAVRLSGPGDDYRDQMAIAGQHLTRAAAHDVGDVSGPQTLELVNTLVATYTSSIEQAAASYRSNPDAPLWTSDLWTASRVLHADGGALALLDGLRDAQIRKLDSEVDNAAGSGLIGPWLGSAILLLAALVLAQVYLHRRFHRTISAGLAVATLCACGLAVAALTFDTGSRLDTTRDTVHELRTAWDQQVSARDAQAQQILAGLIGERCRADAGDCGSTVQRAIVAVPAAATGDSGDKMINGSVQIENGAAEAASGDNGYVVLIPLIALGAFAAIAVGIAPRVAEYRYRAR
jgi:hypothetical protein